MTKYRIDYSPESIEALDHIAEYLSKRSAIAPFTVALEIMNKIHNLETMPRIGQVVEKYPRLRRIVAGSYLVFYEIIEIENLVRIADIIHASRQHEIDRFLAETDEEKR